MIDLITQFADWVQTQSPEERYNYIDSNRCAVSQFGRACGHPELVNLGRLAGSVPAEMDDAVFPKGSGGSPSAAWTYGQLAERLAPHTTMAKAIKKAADNGGRILPRVTAKIDMATALRLEAMANQGRE